LYISDDDSATYSMVYIPETTGRLMAASGEKYSENH